MKEHNSFILILHAISAQAGMKKTTHSAVFHPKHPDQRIPELPKPPVSHRIQDARERFLRRYGILLIIAAAFTVYTILLSAWVNYRTTKRVKAEMAEYYAAELQAYKDEQANARSREYFQSGEASKEAFINQEITAGAQLISKEANDQVKGTKLGVAIARKLNQNYPDTIKEVAAQPNQFMFYSEENTYTQHDWDLAESMIRPLYETGIIPNGLTENKVYFEGNGNSGTARDSYETTTSMSTWRYAG